jgi:hypothetical protein
VTYLTIPTPARSLADAVSAEMATVSRALGGNWTTPEALKLAEDAAGRLRGQMAALRIEMRRIAEEANHDQ